MNSIIRRGVAVGLTVAACALIAGCDDSYLDQSRAVPAADFAPPRSPRWTKLDTTPSAPTLIRTYKKEAELEIWKMKSSGEYALLKTYPMCRWSGQLGPKKREGDMQVPEGFYTIAPGQMNPNSHYYLSFNVGYPNAYDRAYGRSGGNVMVHGVCSSAGCFSMTDEQVADIYAIARESFAGGQREIQLQSYPFHMTAENLAKFRLDPNIDFWKDLKNGSDHFEVTKTEPSVIGLRQALCVRRDAEGRRLRDRRPARRSTRDENVEALVAEKEQKDNAKVADLVASGVKPIRLVYADGGQNPVFAGYKDTSDPDALATGPQEIVLGRSQTRAGRGQDRRSPTPPNAALRASRRRQSSPRGELAARRPLRPLRSPRRQAKRRAASSAGLTGGAQNVKNWLHIGGGQQSAPPRPWTPAPPDEPPSSGAPLPPRRDGAASEGEKAVQHGVAAYAADPAGEAECSRTGVRRHGFAEASAGAVTGPIPPGPAPRIAPIRPERRVMSRAASSAIGKRARWHDDRLALAHPYVDEAARVLGLVTVGVAEPPYSPVDVQRQRVVLERRRHRACGPKRAIAARPSRRARRTRQWLARRWIMKAAAERMSVASPARRLIRPVSASTEAKAIMSAKAVSGAR